MSSDTYRRHIQRYHQEIARLQEKKARDVGKIADQQRGINSASEQLSRSSSSSTIRSKSREVERRQREIAQTQKDIARTENEIAGKQRRLHDAEKNLASEGEREDRRQRQGADRAEHEHERRMQDITGRLTRQDALLQRTARAVADLSRLPERIVVLMLSANPTDQTALRLDEEARTITEMIRKSEHRDALRLESRWAARPLDLLQAINETRPKIVHFSGHGSDTDELVFQGEDGTTRLVTKEAIVQTMAATGDIRLVFLNACFSGAAAEAAVEYVEAAIGMNESIGDDAARVFAAQFYSAIGFGRSVRQAFDQAKAALMLEGIPEDLIPELFVASGLDPDQVILVRPPEAAPPSEGDGRVGGAYRVPQP